MIVLTGGAGFIGSAFLSKLNAEGVRDVLVVDDLGCTAKWQNLLGKSFREYIHKDTFIEALEAGRYSNAIKAIVHLGACSSTTETNVDYLMRNNTDFTRRLALYATTGEVRFIYASSAATYGNGSYGYDDDANLLLGLRPLNAYGFSKHVFDLWAKDAGLLKRIVGLKFFNVYGPNEYYKGEMSSVAWKAFGKIRETGKFSLFKSHRPEFLDGEQKRDFVYVKDCCDVMWWLLNTPAVSGIFNLGSGKARSWNDLVGSVFSALNIPKNIDYISMPEPLRKQYQYFTEAPMERLRQAGYTKTMTSLEDGVRDYVVTHLLASDPHL